MTTSPGTQADWPLDWSIHARRSDWPTSAKMFLAEAVNRTGAALWDLWDKELPGWLAHPQVPRLPDADDAFDGDVPIAHIHAKYGPYIRKILPVAEYQAIFEDEAPPSIILRWELEQNEDICRRHWGEAVRMSYDQAGEREFAEKVIADIARVFGKLAVSGQVRTYVRPLAGGEPQPMPPSLWEIDARVRISACTLNLSDPFGIETRPTHHIFVDAEDLERELQSLPPDAKIQPIPAIEGGIPDREFDGAYRKEVLDWLSGIMEKPPEGAPWKYEYWKRPRVVEAAVDHFGERYNETVFNAAYRRAKEKYPYFATRGRPQKFDD